jgi:hypothetical protein
MVRETSRSNGGKHVRRGARGISAKHSGMTGAESQGEKSRSRPKRSRGAPAARRWSTGRRLVSLTAGRFPQGPASASVGTEVVLGPARRTR